MTILCELALQPSLRDLVHKTRTPSKDQTFPQLRSAVLGLGCFEFGV
jgi:hypothetical protein